MKKPRATRLAWAAACGLLFLISAACVRVAGVSRPAVGADAVAATRAAAVVREIFLGDYSAVRAGFNAAMREALPASELARGRSDFESHFGTFVSMGRPELVRRGGLTVVNIPLHMSDREGQARVTYDAGGRIAGLYLLRTGIPVR